LLVGAVGAVGAEGERVGRNEGAFVGTVGEMLGASVEVGAVGEMLGASVGEMLGISVELDEGPRVGAVDGELVKQSAIVVLGQQRK